MNFKTNYNFWHAQTGSCRYAVIGDPVSHSRSPEMQNAAFSAAKLPDRYARCHVERNRLAEFIEFARCELAGVNVTVPHKQSVIPFLDEITPTAQNCRSVNTLKIVNGKVCGHSTDGEGLRYALQENFNFTSAGKTLLFLGAGGAAWAGAFQLGAERPEKIIIANRTPEKAAELARSLTETLGIAALSLALSSIEELKQALSQSDVLIQTTSCGLKESDPEIVSRELLEYCPAHTAVFDLIYRETKLLQTSRQLGLAAADGKAMLIGQGAASFFWWTGIKPDIQAMQQGFKQAEE